MSGAIRQVAGGPAFHVPSGHYLLSHSVGCLPVAARGELEKMVFTPWAEDGSDAWPAWLAVIDRFRTALAHLLGGAAAQWCPQAGVSAGVFRLVTALPKQQRKALLISRQAFPSVGYALGGLEKFGFELRYVDGDPANIRNWDRAMGSDVAAAVFMHVHSNSGQVTPIAELAAIARARGIFSIADICQSAGIIPLAVDRLGVDAVVGSSVKWLCGGPGAGFLWVDPAVMERLTPPDRGWFSHENPFAFDIADFRYADDSRRFWGGTPSIAPYALASCGIETIDSIGVAAILAHNRRLTDLLRSSLPDRLAPLFDRADRGGTLCLDLGIQAASVEENLRLAGCRIDRRGDILRISFHIFNDDDDADAVAEVLRSTTPSGF